jgi:Predicted periplasmic protein
MVTPAALTRTLIVAAFAAMLAFAPAQARPFVTVTTTVTWSYEEEVGPDDEEGIDHAYSLLDDGALAAEPDEGAPRRHARAPAVSTPGPAKARFGPFAVVDDQTAQMAGDVTEATPRQFAAMLSAFPGLKKIEMIDCPGSLDEEANLALARAIRRARLETVVPAGGSVRSGAVELWLAGVRRRAAANAEFGVHSWVDEDGRQANDYPASDPVHAEYVTYYREMGMDEAKARAFYALTNSTSFDDVRYLSPGDMARFVALD